MAFFYVICPVHLFCLGIRAVFDTFCLVKDGVSLLNCSQEVILAKPQPLVILMHLTTTVNAVVVLVTLHLKPPGIEFCGFRTALKSLVRKGSFWSFNITFVFAIAQSITPMCLDLSGINIAVAITEILFTASRLIVAYFVNYLSPVKFPNGNERNCERLHTWLAYWVTLVLFFLDNTQALLGVTLDFAEKITPLGRVSPGSHDFGVVAHLVLLGIEATFELRLFVFYWNKLFHGNKDLFSSVAILRSIQDWPYQMLQMSPNEEDDGITQRT